MEGVFPALAGTDYAKTSDKSATYNCIAWAAGEDDRWWEWTPDYYPGYFWPCEAVSDHVDELVRAYEAIGFERCDSGELEAEYEKLALYADRDDAYTHAARQLPDGRWTSKLGPQEDIRHEHPDHLRGRAYGNVHCYMRRRRS